MRVKKAQAAIEFSILIATVLLGMTMLVSAMAYKLKENQKSELLLHMQSLGDLILNEYRIAANAEPGFKKIFEIPTVINGFNYSLNFNATFREVSIKLSRTEYLIVFPGDLNVYGTLDRGFNLVERGVDFVNFTHLTREQAFNWQHSHGLR
ncbi:hypothetical protein J7L02_03405 [Candidatus Woesearchaeota archaeon]|nr:hypothetical protein [Candidatus Woesearchaeota archaeon]